MIEKIKSKIENLEILKSDIEAEKAKVNKQIVELEKQAHELDVALLPINAKIEAYYDVIDELAVIKAETEEKAREEGKTPENYSFDVGQ